MTKNDIYFIFICLVISIIMIFCFIQITKAETEDNIFRGISKIPFYLTDAYRDKITCGGNPKKYEFMPDGSLYTEKKYIALKFPETYIKQFPREIKKTEEMIEP